MPPRCLAASRRRAGGEDAGQGIQGRGCSDRRCQFQLGAGSSEPQRHDGSDENRRAGIAYQENAGRDWQAGANAQRRPVGLVAV